MAVQQWIVSAKLKFKGSGGIDMWKELTTNKKILKWKIVGNRIIGRPRIQWQHNAQEDKENWWPYEIDKWKLRIDIGVEEN